MRKTKHDIYIESEQEKHDESQQKGQILKAKVDRLTRLITTLAVVLAGVQVIFSQYSNYINGFISAVEMLIVGGVLTVMLTIKIFISIAINRVHKEYCNKGC